MSIRDRLNKMETFYDMKEHIVFDNGTGFVKAGRSGEDLPRVVTPTVVGTKEIPIDPNTNSEQAQVKM